MKKAEYDELLCDYANKLAKLQEFIEKNKKCPDFKEDFGKIKTDPDLFFLYKSLNGRKKKKMGKSNYIRNEILINKIKKPEFNKKGIPNIQILFDFLDAALKYQKENLVWFTNSEWFNQNSQLIFENLAQNAQFLLFDEKKLIEKHPEEKKVKIMKKENQSKIHNKPNEIEDVNETTNEKLSSSEENLVDEEGRFNSYVKPFKSLRYFQV